MHRFIYLQSARIGVEARRARVCECVRTVIPRIRMQYSAQVPHNGMFMDVMRADHRNNGYVSFLDVDLP